jgi:small subunit ribosomal protein S20
MANHKATKKDIRQSEKRRDRNRYYGKTTRNAIRKLLALTDATEAQAELPKVISMIDKLAKRNVIHKNKASNLKSGIVKRMNTPATA